MKIKSCQQVSPNLQSLVLELEDGQRTTAYQVSLSLKEFSPKVVYFSTPQLLDSFCQKEKYPYAITGGFFLNKKDIGKTMLPLGDLFVGSEKIEGVPFEEPWNENRACFYAGKEEVRIAYRNSFPSEIDGDLLQAGPLLVEDGELANYLIEGFSEGKAQFDSDITEGRYPRAAIGQRENEIVLFACDARSDVDAGLSMDELAEVMLLLGCYASMNLDGGGSTSLICDYKLVNVPRAFFGCSGAARKIRSAIVLS